MQKVASSAAQNGHFTKADCDREAELIFPGISPVIIFPNDDFRAAAQLVCTKYAIAPVKDNLDIIERHIAPTARAYSTRACHYSALCDGTLYSVIIINTAAPLDKYKSRTDYTAHTQYAHELAHLYFLDSLGIRDTFHLYFDPDYLSRETARIESSLAENSNGAVPNWGQQLQRRLLDRCMQFTSLDESDAQAAAKQLDYVKKTLACIKLYEKFGIKIIPDDRTPFEEMVCELFGGMMTTAKYGLNAKDYFSKLAAGWFKDGIAIVAGVNTIERINTFGGKRKPPTDLASLEANSEAWQMWADDINTLGKYHFYPALFSAGREYVNGTQDFDPSSGKTMFDSCIRYAARKYTSSVDFLERFRLEREHGLYDTRKADRLKNARSVLEQLPHRPELQAIAELATYVAQSHIR